MELFEDGIQSSCEADFYRPLLAYINRKKQGNPPPYTPKWKLLELKKQCALALLWKDAGFIEEAGALASWLLKLEPFPTLWCPEKNFDQAQITRFFSKIKQLPLCDGPAPNWNLSFLKTEAFEAAFTLDGEKTGLGAIRGKVDIRAFGPQSNSLDFGIHGYGMDGWVRIAADPEGWLTMQTETTLQGGLKLDFRLVGLKLEHPLSLAFYVKAESCQVGSEELFPKMLNRFRGEVKRIGFGKECFFETKEPQKVEVIPLAGEGCFWDASFLVSYPLSPFTPSLSLNIY